MMMNAEKTTKRKREDNAFEELEKNLILAVLLAMEFGMGVLLYRALFT